MLPNRILPDGVVNAFFSNKLQVGTKNKVSHSFNVDALLGRGGKKKVASVVDGWNNR